MLYFYLQLLDTVEEQTKFEDLYNRYNKFMIYQAFTVTKNHGTSEEIAHECCMYLIRNLDNIDLTEVNKTKRYLAIMAQNKAKDYIKKVRHEVLTDDNDIYHTDAESNLPENILQSNEAHEFLLSYINSLPYPLNKIFFLRFEENMRFSQIGELLGITDVYARQLYRRAKEQIKNFIKEEL